MHSLPAKYKEILTMLITPMTELDAINEMLGMIGEGPVNSLDDSGILEVGIAKRTFNEVNRAVQAKGLWCNSEDNVKLVPDEDGTIPLPINTMSFIPKYLYPRVSLRGNRLYNLETHSYTFDAPVEGRLVLLLPFEELSQATRQYITMRAARLFQKEVLGSDTLDKSSVEEEQKALVAFRAEEARLTKASVLGRSYARVYRRSPLEYF